MLASNHLGHCIISVFLQLIPNSMVNDATTDKKNNYNGRVSEASYALSGVYNGNQRYILYVCILYIVCETSLYSVVTVS